GVAEDAGVLLVAGRVGRDLPQLDVVTRVRRLLQDDAVLGGEPLPDAGEGPGGHAVLQPHPGHDAHALGLDEDLPFVVLARPDQVAEVVVGPAEPGAVPGVLGDRAGHLLGLGPVAGGLFGAGAGL